MEALQGLCLKQLRLHRPLALAAQAAPAAGLPTTVWQELRHPALTPSRCGQGALSSVPYTCTGCSSPPPGQRIYLSRCVPLPTLPVVSLIAASMSCLPALAHPH